MYWNPPLFPQRAPWLSWIELQCFPVCSSFFFSLSPTVSLSLLNELSGGDSHVSMHRSTHRLSNAASCVSALSLFITCKISLNELYWNGRIDLDLFLCAHHIQSRHSAACTAENSYCKQECIIASSAWWRLSRCFTSPSRMFWAVVQTLANFADSMFGSVMYFGAVRVLLSRCVFAYSTNSAFLWKIWCTGVFMPVL